MERYKNKYEDAQKTELAVSWDVVKKINYNKSNVLREHFRSLFEGLCILDCWYEDRKVIFITSESAYTEEQRQLKMRKGTVVKMKDKSFEVKINPDFKDKGWIIIADPQWMGDGWVVWLDGFSGAYSCELLEILNVKYPMLEEQTTI